MKQRIKSLLLVEGLEFPAAPAGLSLVGAGQTAPPPAPLCADGPVQTRTIVGQCGVYRKTGGYHHPRATPLLSDHPRAGPMSYLSDEYQWDWLDCGDPIVGPYWRLAGTQNCPPTGGLSGVGTYGALHSGRTPCAARLPIAAIRGFAVNSSKRRGRPSAKTESCANSLSVRLPPASAPPGRARGHCGRGAQTQCADCGSL